MKHIYLKLVTILALLLFNVSSYALPVGWNNAEAIQVQIILQSVSQIIKYSLLSIPNR